MSVPVNAITRTAAYVRERMPPEGSHDWFHVERVWNLSRRLLRAEGGDSVVVELAALLHDMDDWKIADVVSDSSRAGEWMSSIRIDRRIHEAVIDIIMAFPSKVPVLTHLCRRWKDESCRTPTAWTPSERSA